VAGRILVGTSSWADPGFVAEWYPKGMPARDRLEWYAERFEAVELNSSFYAIPEERTVARWDEATPADFRFDVKLHRLLSRHSAEPDSLPKDLRERADVTPRGRVVLTPELEAAMADATLAALEPLSCREKLGALLLQLSPSFSPRKHALDELAPLVQRLAPQPVAIEFRNRGWADAEPREDVLGWLSEHGAVWVGVDAPDAEHFTIMPALDAVTRDDLAYLRAHGRNAEGYLHGKSVAERFGWRYADEELEELGQRAQRLADDAEQVHVMFNNNRGNDAPVAARRMRELLGQDPGPPVDAAGAQLRMG
jgi:uncharacterized protein YecE (DUF72 family)